MSRELVRVSIKIYKDQQDLIKPMENFNLSGFVREKLDKEFTSSSP